MSKRQVDAPTKFSYWFDNMMAYGMWAKIKLLLIVTLIFIVIVGFLAVAANPELTVREGLWRTLLLTLGKGGQGEITGNSPLYAVLMLIVVFYAMFFMATLISLINGGLRAKVDDLGRGRSAVLESGHTLILGFNSATAAILGELIEANLNERQPQSVVILGDRQQTEMVHDIQARFGNPTRHPKTKVICRTGSVFSLDDLRRCAIGDARSIIVNANSDFETIKALMACSSILNGEERGSSAYAVAAIHEKKNEGSARIAGCDDKGAALDRVELLSLQETLARIIVHTSRQPGLSDVFIELFNFAGNEFYIVSDEESLSALQGYSIAQINLMLRSAIAIGVLRGGDEVVIGNPNDVQLAPGDALVVVEEDDDALRVGTPIEPRKLTAAGCNEPAPSRILVLGAGFILEDVLRESAEYLLPGSSVSIADKDLLAETAIPGYLQERMEGRGIDIQTYSCDIEQRAALFQILDKCRPDSVVVLSKRNDAAGEEEDAHIMALLLLLREYRDLRSCSFNIVSEMNNDENRELAAATGPEDFIIGRHFSALLMSQIAQRREMGRLFECLLSSDGYEVYMNKAGDYVPLNESVSLFDVASAVAAKGDIFIGMRTKKDGRYGRPQVNPPRYDSSSQKAVEYVFGSDDYLVVLSESLA